MNKRIVKYILLSAIVCAFVFCTACGQQEEVWIGNAPDYTTEYHGHRYQRVDNATTWKQAEEKCESAGGHLVTITSQNEQDVVCDLLKEDTRYEVYWIGLRKYHTDKMIWITNETMSFMNWADGEPNGSGLYGQIFMADSESGGHPGEWDDCYSQEDSKGQLTGFICEWDS